MSYVQLPQVRYLSARSPRRALPSVQQSLRQSLPPRRGFALFTALVAIVLLSALGITTLLYVTSYARTSSLFTRYTQTFLTTERSLWETLATVDPSALQALPLHTTIRPSAHITITKLTPTLFWIVSSSSPPLHHRLAMTAMLAATQPDTMLTLQAVPKYAWVDLY